MKLNKTRVGILSLCGILALAGVGGALAYVINEANATGTVETDSAIYLGWGQETVASVEGLTAAEPIYREVVVNYDLSASISSPNAIVTYTLTTEATAINVDISVGHSRNEINTNPDGVYDITTLNTSSAVKAYTLSETGSFTYYLRFRLVAADTLNTDDINGKLTVSLAEGNAVLGE